MRLLGRGGHWYTHITRKVRVKEWERTRTLWCKGHGRVKPGSTRPPDPRPLWCRSLQDVGLWGGSVWRGPETALLPRSQRDSGTCLCPQRKCTWLWVGQVERSHTGIMGRAGWDQNKQTHQITFSDTGRLHDLAIILHSQVIKTWESDNLPKSIETHTNCQNVFSQMRNCFNWAAEKRCLQRRMLPSCVGKTVSSLCNCLIHSICSHREKAHSVNMPARHKIDQNSSSILAAGRWKMVLYCACCGFTSVTSFLEVKINLSVSCWMSAGVKVERVHRLDTCTLSYLELHFILDWYIYVLDWIGASAPACKPTFPF